jgi:methionine sulfoxide reductase heme-binding subunit
VAGPVNSHVLWYATRATGIVSLVLLTAVMVLGVATAHRVSTAAWPRFAWQELHRRLSLVAVVFIGLHIATTVADGYAPIGWISAVVPFTSAYRRLWLGLGTVAVDLLLAVGISSLLRARIKHRTWRALHWLAYLSWPVAVLHTLGTGTDPRLHWVLVLVAACTVAIVLAVGWRLSTGWPARAGLRGGLAGVGAVSLIATSAWAASGPLKAGWAARAGTPASLLAGKGAALSPSSPASSSSAPAVTTDGLPATPFTAQLTGTITERRRGEEMAEVDISATTTGSVQAVLAVQLVGYADDAGGLTLQGSSVSFGPPSAPNALEGTVVGLQGTQLTLSVADAGGHGMQLQVDLTVNGGAVQGTVQAR